MTPCSVKRSNIGMAFKNPLSRAAFTGGIMTISPIPPTGASALPVIRAVARSNNTRPSTSSAKNNGGSRVTQLASAISANSA